MHPFIDLVPQNRLYQQVLTPKFQTTVHNITQILFFSFFFLLFRAAPVAPGSSQARGLIGAAAAGLHHSHSNAGSLTH